MTEVKMIKLQCQECNGVMDVKEDSNVICCPYCGSKKLIIDNDPVKIEKIKSETAIEQAKIKKDVELDKHQTYREIELKKLEKEKYLLEQQEVADFKKGKFSKIILIYCIACIFGIFIADGRVVPIIIAIIQAGMLGVAWLIGMRIIKTEKYNIYIPLAIIAFVLTVPFLCWGPE